jgi:hypothetical protein
MARSVRFTFMGAWEDLLTQIKIEIIIPPELERYPPGEVSDEVRKIFEAEMYRIFGEGQN